MASHGSRSASSQVKYFMKAQMRPSIYRRVGLAIAVTIIASVVTAKARAQNLPPPGAYQAIPNYTGTNAGLLFRQAINDRFSGAQPTSPTLINLSFADLPAEQDGALVYCNNCTAAVLCAAGGSGAFAFGQNGAWSCAASAPVTLSNYTGAVGVTGNSTTGADTLSQVNVNGVLNPIDFGVVSQSQNTGSATTTASSATVTLAAAGDWKNGEGIAIPGGGPTPSISAPSGTTVAASCSGTCSTGYTYQVVALDGACGATAASSATSSVDNASSLSQANYNTLTIPIVAADSALLIYRGSTPIAIIPASEENASNSGPAAFYRDIGNSITISSPCLSSTPPSSAQSDALYTTISSGGGTTTLTLASAASAAVSGATAYHDDSGALMSALTPASYASGVKVAIPPDTQFVVSRPVVVGSASGSNDIDSGIQLQGGAYTSIATTAMMQGMSVVKTVNLFQGRTSNLNIDDSNGAALCAIEHNVDDPAGGVGGAYVGQDEDDNLTFSTGAPYYGVCYTAAAGYDENNSENIIRALTGTALDAGVYIGHLNSLQNTIYGGNFDGENEAAIELHGGSFHLLGGVPTSNDWLFDFEDGGYTHTSSVTGITTEGSAATLRADANSVGTYSAGISLTGGDYGTSSSNTGGLAIDVLNTNFRMHIEGANFPDGASSENVVFDGYYGVIDNCWMGADAITNGSGTLQISHTFFASGNPTVASSGTFQGARNYGNGVSDASAVNQQTNVALESLIMNSGAGSIGINNPTNTRNDFSFSDNGGGTPVEVAPNIQVRELTDTYTREGLEPGTGYVIGESAAQPNVFVDEVGAWHFVTIFSGTGASAAPTCNSGEQHARVCVSDSTACTSGTDYASGGSDACEIWCNGSNWIESGSGC